MCYKIPEGSEGFFNGLYYKVGKFDRAYYWNGEWMPSRHTAEWVRTANIDLARNAKKKKAAMERKLANQKIKNAAKRKAEKA